MSEPRNSPTAPPLPLLEAIGSEARAELLAAAEPRHYPAFALLLAELEPGDELLILREGHAAVTVGAAELTGEEALGEVAPGESVGEIALLTGSLRSASVRAIDPVDVWALRREQLHDLMARYPAIAIHFLALLGHRLTTADRVLARGLDPKLAAAAPLAGLDRQTREIAAHPRPLRRLLQRAFRELIVEHRRELPFFVLSGFLCAFVLARGLIWGLERAGADLELLLRSAYVGGVLFLLSSAGLSPFLYRRPWRRAVCLAFGIGAGLVVNELSVWLSFDIFYRDIFTRDPSVRFDPGILYHRSITLWTFLVVIVLLVQATYLSRFYRRAYYLLRERWIRSR